MSPSLRSQALGALLLALAACGTTTDEFSAGTPDVAGLMLETTGGAEDGTTALHAGTAGVALTATSACEPWQYLCKIREGVRNVNRFVRAVVTPVEALARTTPTVVSGDTRVYGPVTVPAAPADPVATFRLTVQQHGESRNYRWKLEGKPAGAEDAEYVVVLAGRLKRGDQPHRGAGALAIDLTRLAALNRTGAPVEGFNGGGQLLASFVHLGRAKSLVYVARAFVPDATVPGANPVDAAFVAHKTPSGETGVRLASADDYLRPQDGVEPDPATDELLLSRGRWVPGLGGRSVVVVTDRAPPGDVASHGADYFLGVSCWDRAEVESYHKLFACTVAPTRCVDVTPTSWPPGDPASSACRPGTDLADEGTPPERDPMSRQPEPHAPFAADSASVPGSLADVAF
jgi:hypothetical protein